MGRSLISTAVLVGIFAGLGCESNHYEIELTPQGDSIKRDLTTWHEGKKAENEEHAAFPEEELQKIAEAYGAPVPANKNAKHHFTQTITDRMPEDIGGSGHYAHWETELGTASLYVERFRGNDDLLRNMQDRLQAADQLVDLLTRWLESELKQEPRLPALQRFLNRRFREDMKNLSLYAWTAEVELSKNREAKNKEAILDQCAIRMGQYLVERSYLTWGQLPLFSRALDEAKDNNPARLLRLIQRFLATKMGIPQHQPLPKSLQFLSDPAALKTSLNEFLRQTKEYREFATEWKTKQMDDPDAGVVTDFCF